MIIKKRYNTKNHYTTKIDNCEMLIPKEDNTIESDIPKIIYNDTQNRKIIKIKIINL